jgi:hypothetical protein
MTNKITKKEFFGMLKGVVESSQPANMIELIAFIDHEVELIDRKAENRKAGVGKKAEANNALTTIVIEELAKIGKCTITDLLKKSEVLANYVNEDGKSLSNQKISALLKPLYGGDNPTIERTMEKKVVYFRVIE